MEEQSAVISSCVISLYLGKLWKISHWSAEKQRHSISIGRIQSHEVWTLELRAPRHSEKSWIWSPIKLTSAQSIFSDAALCSWAALLSTGRSTDVNRWQKNISTIVNQHPHPSEDASGGLLIHSLAFFLRFIWLASIPAFPAVTRSCVGVSKGRIAEIQFDLAGWKQHENENWED